MIEKISKTQIDKLGERLRSEQTTDEDLVMLDAYRLSFADAYETTVGVINNVLRLTTTGRPSKSTQSIREKLQRESIRLSQIQDIAGCRIIVGNTEHQETILLLLLKATAARGLKTAVLDRRVKPSYGYRAVHVVVEVEQRAVEVQLRTELQHIWAQLSEKLSDTFDPTIKYGGGATQVKAELARISNHISEVEEDESKVWLIKQGIQAGEIKETVELSEFFEEVRDRGVASRSALYDMMAVIMRQTGEIID